MSEQTQCDLLVALAKTAVEEYVRYGRKARTPATLTPEMAEQAGAFVCLKTRGHLRGCIGTVEAVEPSIASEIINNAISAAVRDPRFEPVRADELADLEYTVDILSAAEPVSGLDELDPKVYGVIVESGYKRGLLLPDLEGVDTVDEQVSIAMQKAGIRSGEDVCISRFTVTRHE